MKTDAWNPSQYERFAAERRQPFDDLLRLVSPVPGGRGLDLGCGTGELTVEMHRALGLRSTLAIDTSASMLERAPTEPGVTFAHGDLATFEPPGPVDVVFANASVQWVGDHEAVLAHLARHLAPGGQLAVQVPRNADHPSHTVAAEVATEFLADPPPDPVAVNVLLPERYAEILHELGFAEQHVRLQVYGHLLDSTTDLVEWTKGTSLTRFKNVLSPEQYDQFVDRYRERLVDHLGDRRPYFYPFKRVLVWARKTA
jgi:trans-aconitate 2-methyltransferase